MEPFVHVDKLNIKKRKKEVSLTEELWRKTWEFSLPTQGGDVIIIIIIIVIIIIIIIIIW